MNTEVPRRTGPHAPLPNAPEAAAPVPANGIAAEDSRARAAKRTAELLEHIGTGDGTDKFAIDPKIIPDGWSYEFKRFTVLGQEDPSYQVSLADSGWEAVPAKRHPELMPIGYQGATILRDGQILMERPLAITEKRKQKDYQNAREQVRAKEEQLTGAAPGEFERRNKGDSLVKINKSYEPMAIPKE